MILPGLRNLGASVGCSDGRSSCTSLRLQSSKLFTNQTRTFSESNDTIDRDVLVAPLFHFAFATLRHAGQQKRVNCVSLLCGCCFFGESVALHFQPRPLAAKLCRSVPSTESTSTVQQVLIAALYHHVPAFACVQGPCYLASPSLVRLDGLHFL